jgi:hypothetical protein
LRPNISFNLFSLNHPFHVQSPPTSKVRLAFFLSEEKQLSLAKDVRVVFQGNEAKLTDVKIADNGPFAMLRLSLDQKSVQSLFVSQPR